MIPLTTALNANSIMAGQAMAPIASSGGLLSGLGGLASGLSSIINPLAGAAGLLGGSGMFGGGMDSSSASTATNFYAGDMQVGGSKETLYVLAALMVLLIIVLAKGK